MTPEAERPGSGDDQTRPPQAESSDQGRGARTRFRKTLLRVLLVQVVTLALLWFMQATYHG